MKVQNVWLNEFENDSVSIREIRIDFDNDYHIAIDFSSKFSDGMASDVEMCVELENALNNIRNAL